MKLYNLVRDNEINATCRTHFLNKIADSLGLSQVELDEVIDFAENTEAPIPKDEGGRVGYIYHLLFLLRTHGEIDEERKELCRRMGFQLCLNSLMVNELIDMINQSKAQEIPKELMLNAVKRHYN